MSSMVDDAVDELIVLYVKKKNITDQDILDVLKKFMLQSESGCKEVVKQLKSAGIRL